MDTKLHFQFSREHAYPYIYIKREVDDPAEKILGSLALHHGVFCPGPAKDEWALNLFVPATMMEVSYIFEMMDLLKDTLFVRDAYTDTLYWQQYDFHAAIKYAIEQF